MDPVPRLRSHLALSRIPFFLLAGKTTILKRLNDPVQMPYIRIRKRMGRKRRAPRTDAGRQVGFIEMKIQPFADILQEYRMLDYWETEKRSSGGF